MVRRIKIEPLRITPYCQHQRQPPQFRPGENLVALRNIAECLWGSFMTTNRRDLLRGAAFSGISLTTLGACENTTATDNSPLDQSHGNEISTQTIAEAEKLQKIAYTPAERAQLLETIEADITLSASVRAHQFQNADERAMAFNPKLQGFSVGTQKNSLSPAAPTNNAPPGDDGDIAFASIAQQGAWLRAGMLTSIQLTEIYLKRIAAHDEKLSAFITVTPEIAREQATKADKDFAAGRDRGPLQGIPYGLKDLADTKGVLTSWGATPFKDRVPERDAEIVKKLQRARAVMLGKTSCGAIAYGDQWYGAKTRNPWNLEEGSSGSSAGSAAAVSAGMCGFAIGTETLGSIISPSERCGSVGLRPTFGRISRHGVMSLCPSLDKVGPLCRHAEDSALVLAELNGFDADDPSGARIGFAYDANVDLGALTIGYVPEWFDNGDSADASALAALRELGVKTAEFPWPELDFDVLLDIVNVEAAAVFADLTFDGHDDNLIWQGNEAWPNLWRRARFVSAVDFVQMDRLRRKLMVALNNAFEGFDGLIGPHDGGSALLATNMTGHPQLALRAGFSQTTNRNDIGDSNALQNGETHRTPRGISLWGPLFQEGKMIAIARALEAQLSVATERPPGF